VPSLNFPSPQAITPSHVNRDRRGLNTSC